MEQIGSIMIITLGLGATVEHGIFTSIRQKTPKKIIYIATEASIATEEKIRKVFQAEASLQDYPEVLDIIKLEDGANLKDVYEKTLDAFKKAINDGFKWNQIILDFTSGTKVMSAGAVLAGFLSGCTQFVYIGGEQSERDMAGRICSGKEMVIDPSKGFLGNFEQRIGAQLKNAQFKPEDIAKVLNIFKEEQKVIIKEIGNLL